MKNPQRSHNLNLKELNLSKTKMLEIVIMTRMRKTIKVPKMVR